MGDLDLSLDGALSLAGQVFNELATVAAGALGVGLGMIAVSLVIGYLRYKRFTRG